MRRSLALLTAPLLFGCSDLEGAGDQLVALELVLPQRLAVEVNDTIQLTARGLNQAGDPVPADITWTTPDATLDIDASGRLTGVTPGSTGRVQARAGSLTSDLVTFNVLAGPDTLVLEGPDTSRVVSGAPASAALDARLDTHSPPASPQAPAPLASGSIVYEIVEPAFASPDARTVELLPGQALIDTATTGADGSPSAAITVGRVAGVAAPDSAVVEIRAQRLSGRAVPGSGQRFVVRFDP